MVIFATRRKIIYNQRTQWCWSLTGFSKKNNLHFVFKYVNIFFEGTNNYCIATNMIWNKLYLWFDDQTMTSICTAVFFVIWDENLSSTDDHYHCIVIRQDLSQVVIYSPQECFQYFWEQLFQKFKSKIPPEQTRKWILLWLVGYIETFPDEDSEGFLFGLTNCSNNDCKIFSASSYSELSVFPCLSLMKSHPMVFCLLSLLLWKWNGNLWKTK